MNILTIVLVVAVLFAAFGGYLVGVSSAIKRVEDRLTRFCIANDARAAKLEPAALVENAGIFAARRWLLSGMPL